MGVLTQFNFQEIYEGRGDGPHSYWVSLGVSGVCDWVREERGERGSRTGCCRVWIDELIN